MRTNCETTVYPLAKVGSDAEPHTDLDHASFTLSNLKHDDEKEIILDYGRCEGGIPVFHIESATGPIAQVPFRVTYSETRAGIDHTKGDGPFFLFSSAMDSYRSCLHQANQGAGAQIITSRHVQYSQRYQKLSLVHPGTSIKFFSVGFAQVRPETPVQGSFNCSDEKLNRIWRDGVRTLDKCTVRRGETRAAWDVTSQGTRVHAGHWAPCRQGTAWSDKIVTFEAKIEQSGASWGIRMVANGLVLCLDGDSRTLEAFEGLSNQSSLLPVIPKGSWRLPPGLNISGWFSVKTIAEGESVTIYINGERVAEITGICIKSILAGDCVNAGSVAFGGPEGWVTTYRNLLVEGLDASELYNNSMKSVESARVLADFQVGSNSLACTIDGAKRDRACFGGDVFVMGRSLAYSTVDIEAWKGSISLLISHQRLDGYLGNLSPIQTPEHEESMEPPSYAFYSLTYALLLVVSIRDYWMHSGDEGLRQTCWNKLDKLISFTDKFTNDTGLIEAPPHLQMTWFPMGGPVIGVSAGLNVAYYNALKAMAEICPEEARRSWYLSRASAIKHSIHAQFWNDNIGILRMALNLPEDGFCQDINAYALTQSLIPRPEEVINKLTSSGTKLPPAFQDLGHWDRAGVASPYASGFAVEALFSGGHASYALDLLRTVWGFMSDQSSSNYSGAHWEAMKLDGSPYNHDVSLAHGWSTWPVFLLPRYLAGLYPRTPGWKEIGIEPVFTNLAFIEYALDTVAGKVYVSVAMESNRSSGEICIIIPIDSKALIKLPEEWELHGDPEVIGSHNKAIRRFRKLDI